MGKGERTDSWIQTSSDTNLSESLRLLIQDVWQVRLGDQDQDHKEQNSREDGGPRSMRGISGVVPSGAEHWGLTNQKIHLQSVVVTYMNPAILFGRSVSGAVQSAENRGTRTAVPGWVQGLACLKTSHFR